MKVILPETDITAASRNSLRDLAVLVDFIFYFFAGNQTHLHPILVRRMQKLEYCRASKRLYGSLR